MISDVLVMPAWMICPKNVFELMEPSIKGTNYAKVLLFFLLKGTKVVYWSPLVTIYTLTP